MYKTSKRNLYIFSAVAVVSFGVFVLMGDKELVIPEKIESKEYREFWISRVDEVGAGDAYEEFKKSAQRLPIGTQHLAGHIIGDVIYEQEGVSGIAICDSSFGFACFHGLFTIALATDGVKVVKEIDKECVERFGPLGTGCTHGIGHGVMEFFGYDKLNEALAICDNTTQLVSILGCTSGVFMEYNTPLSETESGGLITLPRKFDPKNTYSSCGGIPDKYKNSCYFELGTWWALSIGENWKHMEGLCSALSNTVSNKFCMLGVGYALGNKSDYNLGKISRECDGMGKDARLFCRAGAHWALWSNPDHRKNAPQLCDVFSEEENDICVKEGRPDLLRDL
jgi:hypothetical protein